MSRIDYEKFVGTVAERGGLGRDEAAHAAEVTLRVLGERLPEIAVRAVAFELPEPLAVALRSSEHTASYDLAAFYARVGLREGVKPGFAVEHTQAVCSALGELLGAEARAHIEKHLPEPFAELFAPRQSVAPATQHSRITVAMTLSEGRPGSGHPLSEARRERMQRDSVAARANPHGETKLSSARGLTQEREHETLATGHAGSSRPLSGGKS